MQNYRLSHSYKVGPVGYAVSGSYQKCDPYLWNSDFESKNFSSNLYVDMPLDGELTAETLTAIRRYQADGGLDTPVLSLKAAQSLGLIATPL